METEGLGKKGWNEFGDRSLFRRRKGYKSQRRAFCLTPTPLGSLSQARGKGQKRGGKKQNKGQTIPHDPHPATKQQVMREGEKARGGGDGAKSQPCPNLPYANPFPTPGCKEPRRPSLPTFLKCSRSDPFLSKSCFHLGLYQAHPSPASLPRFTQLDAIPLG